MRLGMYEHLGNSQITEDTPVRHY